MKRILQRRVAVGLVAGLLAVSACGSDDSSSGDAEVSADAGDSDTGDADASDGSDGSPRENGTVAVDGAPLTPFDPEVADPTVGSTAPVVDGEGFDGSPLSFGGASENPTMVVFLAHWCPHCNDEIPELVELEEAGSLPDDLDVVGVSTAVDPSAPNYPPSEWIDEKGWPWPTMADDTELSAISAMGGTSFPFTVILDADGSVLARKGGSSTAEATLEFIDDALGA